MTNISGSNSTTSGWVYEPDCRGTWSILSTCLLTIILCCWTVVCPNIPAPSDGYFTSIRDKLRLALMGVLGPEFFYVSEGTDISTELGTKAHDMPRGLRNWVTVTGPWCMVCTPTWVVLYSMVRESKPRFQLTPSSY
ncbi:hypothetical protein BDV59DRAFT_159745 [Aspergillus ambiguus]|uniref:uncharacterized protein n=1 Tax=Aspergillus ambiguus TaxID=176160 RepID=UPI003CCD029A